MKLYKYCVAERIDVLRGGMIRFTPPIEFNDPFEVLPAVREGLRRDAAPAFFRSILQSNQDEARGHFEQAMRENHLFSLLKQLPAEFEVDLSFERALESLDHDLPEMLREFLDPLDALLRESFPPDMQQRLNNMMGVLCLTERPDNLLMWGHYADSHRGFVLEFDADHPFFNQRKSDEDLVRYLCKVQYSRRRPQITLFDPDEDPEKFAHRIAREFFLTKSVDWEYEQEWRMIMSLKDATEPRLSLFAFPPSAVTQVIVGSRMSPEKRDEFESLVQNDARWKHLKLDAATVDRDEFRVNVPAH